MVCLWTLRLCVVVVRCNERCESQTSAVPDGYPKVGYYCRLHDYQKPKRGQALPDDESTAKWLRKIPSFAAYAAEEEKKTAQLGADQKFILHLKVRWHGGADTGAPPLVLLRCVSHIRFASRKRTRLSFMMCGTKERPMSAASWVRSLPSFVVSHFLASSATR